MFPLSLSKSSEILDGNVFAIVLTVLILIPLCLSWLSSSAEIGRILHGLYMFLSSQPRYRYKDDTEQMLREAYNLCKIVFLSIAL